MTLQEQFPQIPASVIEDIEAVANQRWPNGYLTMIRAAYCIAKAEDWLLMQNVHYRAQMQYIAKDNFDNPDTYLEESKNLLLHHIYKPA